MIYLRTELVLLNILNHCWTLIWSRERRYEQSRSLSWQVESGTETRMTLLIIFCCPMLCLSRFSQIVNLEADCSVFWTKSSSCRASRIDDIFNRDKGAPASVLWLPRNRSKGVSIRTEVMHLTTPIFWRKTCVQSRQLYWIGTGAPDPSIYA